ncbi:TPA: hypothetical protein DHW62_01650 [candidate division WWE3 bacterium]|nr:hypothetical protein [candidate division WWE3 bacterium]
MGQRCVFEHRCSKASAEKVRDRLQKF